ncbi:hypothetical protein D3C81_1435650 [compost metagenome]
MRLLVVLRVLEEASMRVMAKRLRQPLSSRVSRSAKTTLLSRFWNESALFRKVERGKSM